MMPCLGSRLLFLSALALILWPGLGRAQWREDGVRVCPAPGIRWPSAIIGDGAGGAIIAWVDFRGGVCLGCADVYAQHLLASGAVDPAWPRDGVAVSTAPGDQWPPVMIPDGAGGAIVAWHDYRRCNLSGCADVYAQHLLASGAVDPAWPADGLALSTAPNDQTDPAIVSDGAGGAIVAWEDRRSGSADIYAQHVLAAGVVDPSLPTDGVGICTATGYQYSPLMVSDGAGGAILTWVQAFGDVHAHHVLATGVADPAWPADGLALSGSYREKGNHEMVADGAGGAIVAWTEAYCEMGGCDPYCVYAQHVLATGVLDPAWPVHGLAPSPARWNKYLGGIVADRAGGAIVVWQESRGRGQDIFAQHLLASGVVDPAWPADGLALSTAPPPYRHPSALVADGTGGAIVVWSERGGASDDIYAQHVRGSGTLDAAWPADGRVLCSAPGDQWNPLIAADGAGRAIVTWGDQRSGEPDVYARRVYLGGGTPAGKPGPPATFGLQAPQAGPSRGEVTIRFDLPSAEPVWVEVFDVAGRAVRTLATRQEMEAGTHVLAWDRADQAGAPLRRGVYLVRVSAGARSATGKVVVF